MGTTVAVDAVGAKNREEVSKTSETQSRSFLAISAALTVILMFFQERNRVAAVDPRAGRSGRRFPT